MRLYLMLPLFLLSIICHSQERKYFTKFQPVEKVYGWPTWGCYYFTGKYPDSLMVSLKILQSKVVDSMECTSFELKYNGDKVVFRIGIKDSVMYTFKGNRLNKPVKMFDFRQKINALADIPFLPFSEKSTITEPFNNVGDADRYFSVSGKETFLLGGLRFSEFYISLNRGFFFSITREDDDLTYTNLEEVY